MREKENLTLLGNQQNNYETDYNPGLLETFVNKHPENDYFVKFNCPEFTSLCPITGQPDYFVCPRRENGGKQELKAVPVFIP